MMELSGADLVLDRPANGNAHINGRLMLHIWPIIRLMSGKFNLEWPHVNFIIILAFAI